MATESNSSNAKTQAKRATTEAKHAVDDAAAANKKAAKKTVAAEKKVVAAEKPQVQAVAESAVDLPVGAVLSVSDRISELVEPWTARSRAEKQISAYRSQLRKTLKRTERRGSSARKKATTEARKTRNRVEREARKRQRSVETRASGARSTSRRRAPRAWSERRHRQHPLRGHIGPARMRHLKSPRMEPLCGGSFVVAPLGPEASRRTLDSGHLPGDGDREGVGGAVRPAGLAGDVGAELEADAAAVVVAEGVGEAEGAAGRRSGRCGTRSRAGPPTRNSNATRTPSAGSVAPRWPRRPRKTTGAPPTLALAPEARRCTADAHVEAELAAADRGQQVGAGEGDGDAPARPGVEAGAEEPVLAGDRRRRPRGRPRSRRRRSRRSRPASPPAARRRRRSACRSPASAGGRRPG